MALDIRTTDHGASHLRELVKEGEALGGVWVLERSMWLLGTRVSFGGLGGVQTKPEHRMKGYGRRLMEDTVRYMTDRGLDVSMLFGIRGFYNKFGFTSCLPEHRVTIETRDAERALKGVGEFATRPIRDDDYPFVLDLHNGANRFRAGARVRSAGEFDGFRRGTRYGADARAFVVEDSDGRLMGYGVWDDSKTEVTVVEVNGADRQAYCALLAEFAKAAIDRRCGQIEFHMPPDHGFIRFLMPYGCQVHTTYSRMGGGMMRILNQDTLFRKIQPALEERIACSALATRRIALHIETDLDSTALRLGAAEGTERVLRVSLPQGKLMQIMVGYRGAADVLADEGVEAEGDAAPVLDALFGGQDPFVSKVDQF